MHAIEKQQQTSWYTNATAKLQIAKFLVLRIVN